MGGWMRFSLTVECSPILYAAIRTRNMVVLLVRVQKPPPTSLKAFENLRMSNSGLAKWNCRCPKCSQSFITVFSRALRSSFMAGRQKSSPINALHISALLEVSSREANTCVAKLILPFVRHSVFGCQIKSWFLLKEAVQGLQLKTYPAANRKYIPSL